MREFVERKGLWVALAVAAGARALPLFFGLEHYGDSPVRIEAAERWASQPHLWRGFLEAFQYGPLHLTLIGAAIRLGLPRVAAARLWSLAGGLIAVWLVHRLTRKLGKSPEAALLAALGLALSPLHIQASTTGASEAPFLALLLGTLALLYEEHTLLAALCLGAAGLIRYDGWLYLPLVTALLWWRTRDVPRSVGFFALGVAPALGWLWINHLYAGDALAPLHHINEDHRALAAQGLQFFGPFVYRLYCLVYWPVAVCAVATPVLGVLAVLGAFRALLRREDWELAALAWLPAAYFTFRAAVLADFRPLSRFALVAGALSLPYAWDALASFSVEARRRALAAALAALVVTAPALAALSLGRNGSLAEWARPLSPISSLPPGVAQAARYLRDHAKADDVVLLDGVWDYLDVPLAFAAGLPDHSWIRKSWTVDYEERLKRHDPTLAVLIYQGELQYVVHADETAERFTFRGLKFCREAQFVYATVFRRCL